MKRRVQLIILNYNGLDLLKRFLPSAVDAAAASRHDCTVTVLDNASSDGSLEYVRSQFPGVRAVAARENRVLCSYNDVVAECEDDIVVLLNNDLKLDRGSIDPLIDIFDKHEDAFFAAFHGDRAAAKFRWGILEADVMYPNRERLMEEPGVTLSAGVAAFDKKKFLELGGYDEIYLPGRYEDVDLCYRGWKRGWKGYYVPQSRHEHMGGVSFDRAFGHEATQTMVFRNSVLFTWKNMSGAFRRTAFWGWLALRLLHAGLTGRRFVWVGFRQAWGRRKAALRSRRVAARLFMKSDSETVRQVNAGALGRAG